MNPLSILTQIMVHDWQTKGYAISEWNNDDSEFFRMIGIDPDQVNIATTTGTNIIYTNNKGLKYIQSIGRMFRGDGISIAIINLQHS